MPESQNTPNKTDKNLVKISEHGPKLTQPHALVLALAGIAVALISLIGFFIFNNTTFPGNFGNPLEEAPPPPRTSINIGQCQNKSDESLRVCCEEWREEADLLIPACEGEWEAFELGCQWRCFEEDKTVSDTVIPASDSGELGPE